MIDNKGNIIFPDIFMMLLAEDLLRKNSKGSIVFDVKCSANLEKIIAAYFGIRGVDTAENEP